MVDQWLVFFATGNCIADISIALFAFWVYFHSEKKEEFLKEREIITYQTYEEFRRLDEHRRTDKEAKELYIRSLVHAQAEGRISQDEFNKKWDELQQNNKKIEQHYSDEKSKIQREEGNRISEFQGKYFPFLRKYKRILIVIISLFSFGIMIQLIALSFIYDFTQLMALIDC